MLCLLNSDDDGTEDEEEDDDVDNEATDAVENGQVTVLHGVFLVAMLCCM